MLKIYYLLDKTYKRRALVLLLLLIFGILLEVMGIGLILPVLTILATDDIVGEYPQVKPLMDMIGNPDRTQLVQVALLTLLGIYVFKGLYLVFLAWKQTSFSYDLSEKLSSELHKGYMSKPYAYHLNRNSADLIQYTTAEISQLTSASVNSLLLITEGAAIAGILVLLITIEPFGALSVMILFSLMALAFYKLTRKRLAVWGQIRQHHDTLRIQYLLQSFGGIKDILLLGKANYFTKNFTKNNKISFKINTKFTTLQSVPRLWFEVIGVIALVCLIFVQLAKGLSLQQMLPTLAVFVAAAFRIIPSLNRIMGSIQTIRYANHSINIIYDEFEKLNDEQNEMRFETTNEKLPFEQRIELNGVKFKYDNSEEDTLDLSLNIEKGTMVGFVGESGAGKSTVIDVILGLLDPYEGTVKVDGLDIRTCKRKWQNQIGYVPQSIYFTDDTLRNNIAFGLEAEKVDENKVLKAIEMAQLGSFLEQLPEGLDTVIGENGVRISGGQRQRIGIARALYHDPSVLVLDEATSALDNKTEDNIMKAINALHGTKTIIIIAHRLRTVEQCDHLFLLEKGHLKEKDPNLDELDRKAISNS